MSDKTKVEIEFINAEEKIKYQDAIYEVITIIPYVEAPQKRTYHLTVEELKDFIYEGEEFVISIKALF